MWDILRCWQQAELPRKTQASLNLDNVLPQDLYIGCSLCLHCASLRCHMIGSLSLRSLLKCHLLRQRSSLTTLSKVIPPHPAITLFIIFLLCGTTYHQNVSFMKAGFLFCHQHLAHPETPAGTRWVCGPCREPEIPSTSDDPHPISQSSFCSKQLAPFLYSLENLFFNSLFLCCPSWPETVRTLCFLSNQRNTVPFSVQSKCPAWYHGSHFLASLLRELSYQEVQRAGPISAWKGWHPAPALRMVPSARLPAVQQ